MLKKILFWLPRILGIVSIMFIMLFSLDALTGGDSPGKKIIGFLIHNIPSFILIAALIFAWKYEITGGIVFIVLSVAMAVYFKAFSGNSGSLIIISPFLLTGVLFILHQVISGKNQHKR
ncbi:MAG TPA: hypothetical protein PKI12_07935 [Bacteroidales bacterium]|nr:hypothetical protein [Bacteroidales bacterium]